MKYFYRGVFNPRRLSLDNIDRLSTGLMPSHAYVLELGCATGFMTRYFTKTKHCRVVGVELDPRAAALARAHARIINGNLEDKAVWKKIEQLAPFDTVFASAVIEHLKDPWQALKSIRQVLKPRGQLVITTSNIAHWRMRLNLLLGRWHYQDYGTLDNTHLRFFTYHTFQHLVTFAGFTIDIIAVDPAGGLKYCNWLARLFPNFYAHQMVILAHKS